MSSATLSRRPLRELGRASSSLRTPPRTRLAPAETLPTRTCLAPAEYPNPRTRLAPSAASLSFFKKETTIKKAEDESFEIRSLGIKAALEVCAAAGKRRRRRRPRRPRRRRPHRGGMIALRWGFLDDEFVVVVVGCFGSGAAEFVGGIVRTAPFRSTPRHAIVVVIVHSFVPLLSSPELSNAEGKGPASSPFDPTPQRPAPRVSLSRLPRISRVR